jgi:hypothetical protein
MELTAYFDESGHDDKLLIMGGFVSTSERWARFSVECDRIKSYFDIPYIHATELFNLKKTRHYGHLPLKLRHQVAGALMSAIIDHTAFSVTAVVIPRVYNRLTTKQWRSTYGTAYSSCIDGILVGLTEYLDLPPGETLTLSIFLEDGHAHAGEAENVIRDYKTFSDNLAESDVPVIRWIEEPTLRIGEYGRHTKEMAPPLWAADLISYCTYNQIMRGDSFCADIMQKIHDRVPGFGVTLFDEQIQYMIDVTGRAETEMRERAEDIHNLVKYSFQFGVTAQRIRGGIMMDFSGTTPEQLQGWLDNAKGKYQERS